MGKVVEVLSGRAGAERGALASAAGAILMLILTIAIRPARLPSLVGPDPMPQALAMISCAAAMMMGGEVGRRAVRYRATRARRLAILLLWTFVAYLASVTVAVASLVLAEEGAGRLADPFLLVVRGLIVCLLLLPWAVVPIAVTAVAVERWTRTGSFRAGGGPGGGPGGGTRMERPAARTAEPEGRDRRRGAA